MSFIQQLCGEVHDYFFYQPMTVDLNKLKDLPPEQFQTQVRDLATQIGEGRRLEHLEVKANECSLQTFKQKTQNVPSLNVLEDLNSILKKSIERGLDAKLEPELNVIRKLRDQILAANPIRDASVQEFIADPLSEIMSKLTPREAAKSGEVSKRWRAQSPEAQIKAINEKRILFKDVLPAAEPVEGVYLKGKEVIAWLAANPACRALEYADFSGVDEFDNDCLQKLTELCPNLKHLTIWPISGDALKFLEKIPKLESLDISQCTELDKDALKNLKYTPHLQSLNIDRCSQFEAPALEHLSNTPELRSLSMESCKQLEKDGLKHLANTKKLQSLSIYNCNFEKDALKHLINTPDLLRLDISHCDKLEEDALKHLDKTPKLQSLRMGWTPSLEADALKHLKKTPDLRSLNISYCDTLQKNSLQHLVNTPLLENLNLTSTDLEADALQHLKHTSQLRKLILFGCHFLAKDSLKNLEKTPKLRILNIQACRELEPDTLKNLAYTPDLRDLNISVCAQLERDALKHLENTPHLKRLRYGHSNLDLAQIPAKLSFLLNQK